jgi:5'(3')-deoxyribonucleotidase
VTDDYDRSVEMIDKHVRELGEHFDSVQIMITTKHNDSTRCFQRGCGDWYARFGNAKAWVVREEEILRIETKEDRE